MIKILSSGASGAAESNTGLSEEVIGGMITTANNDARSAVEALGNAMQEILNKLGQDWGTQDSISDVDNDIIPGLTNAQNQVAAELKAVIDTVRATALKQASDTNNDFSGLPQAEMPTIVTLTNQQNSVLDIGLVGVKAELEKDVATAGQNSKDTIDEALDTMKSHLYETAAQGFVDAGHTVQNKIEEHMGNVISALDTALEELMTSVNEYTTGVVRYEQDIQGEWVQVESEAGGSN